MATYDQWPHMTILGISEVVYIVLTEKLRVGLHPPGVGQATSRKVL
ncbi:MAG: hypothetical protein ACYTEE_06680 [Planctomycetota bacterium]|jgi:hypothetical protein